MLAAVERTAFLAAISLDIDVRRSPMLPPLDEEGYLPPGLHRAGLREVLDRFGVGSVDRKSQAAELDSFVDWARKAGVARLIVDGSFLSDFPRPNDVDLVILPGPGYPLAELPASEILWPFLHVIVGVDDGDVSDWVDDFGTDRTGRSKGLVEVIL